MKPSDDNFFARHPWAALALIFVAYTFVSTMDYQDARRSECASHNQQYNKETDKCQ